MAKVLPRLFHSLIVVEAMTGWNAWHVRCFHESGEMRIKTPSSFGRVYKSTKVHILLNWHLICTLSLGVILLSLRKSWTKRQRRMNWRRRRKDNENNLVPHCFATLFHFLVWEDGAEESTLHPWSCMPTRRDVLQSRKSLPKWHGSSTWEATALALIAWL